MRYLVVLIGLILLIFLGLPDLVLYSKDGFARWFPFVIIFLVIPFVIYKTLIDFKIRRDIGLGISIGSVLIIGPLFGIWTGKLSDKDLEKNGIVIEGIVFEKWQVKRRRSWTYKWLFKAEFKISDEYFYTYSREDKDNSVNEGDTVLIKYSKRNPENNTIIKVK